MFKYHKQLFLRKHVDKKSSQSPWTTRKRKRGKKQRMRTLSSVCLSAIQSSFYTPRNAKCVIVGFFSAKYRSFMNPRRNEQSPDFKMQFGDSICHSFSGTQTHEDQRPEGLRSPGKNLCFNVYKISHVRMCTGF